jgi:O-antigen/teichoic acid export membrane protein
VKKVSLNSIVSLLPEGIRDAIFSKNHDELTWRVIRGSFWALSGSVISKGFSLIATIIIARILGKLHYGELGIIQSTITMFTAFAGFGLGVTSTKYVAELRDNDPVKAGSIIASSNLVAGIFGFLITILFVILAPVISSDLLKAPGLSNEMRIGAIILFFSAVNGAQTGAMAGFENFKGIAKINVASGLITFPVQILLAYFFSLKGAILGLGITVISQWILNFYLLRRTAEQYKIRIRLKHSFRDISYLWKFSLPALMGGILVSISLWFANTMLVSNSNGFNEMAIFNAASQWQNIVLFIPFAVSQISLPLFSNSKNDAGRFLRLIRYNVLLNFMICFVLAVIFASFSKTIMQSYGENFREGYIVLVILAGTAVLISVNSVIGQVLAGIGRMWVGFFINLVWAILFLALSHHFITSELGASGLARSMLLSYLAHTVTVASVSYYFIKKKYRSDNTGNEK